MASENDFQYDMRPPDEHGLEFAPATTVRLDGAAEQPAR